MPCQPKTYYCEHCGRELWPTRDEKYYACHKGCTKLLPPHKCSQMTLEERKQGRREREEHERQIEADKQLPFCHVVCRPRENSRKHDIWFVEGMDGHFIRVGYGKLPDCVHAIDPANRFSGRKFVVSLRQATNDEVVRYVFGGRG